MVDVGIKFATKHGGRTDRFVREQDDSNARFESERIRITHLSCSDNPKMMPYTFGTEPEWFRQRRILVNE